ncbi:hypothetical protein J5N97_015859 [Dioscorea zingiberensis]|uniref:Uncharacterized protein n=1 Tax=Dioscorea zingiberensis TaxID=325984 RepID=A0A9D5HET4_9LILI|nr:hypothetical protein J5N97_015859 [Dioscorea zingiberensis]
MGCYSSKNSDSPANRVARWRSTGIVALRDRKLKAVPAEIFDVDRFVRTLDLTNNSIVGSLSRLEKFSVSGNLLMSLPKTIGDLQFYLTTAAAAKCFNNKLKSLPESIGAVASLEELQADGAVPVQLAWGVNLPAHLVIVKVVGKLAMDWRLRESNTLNSLSFQCRPTFEVLEDSGIISKMKRGILFEPLIFGFYNVSILSKLHDSVNVWIKYKLGYFTGGLLAEHSFR